MKPYYEADGITIYHGDCREIGQELRADVLITDPPYGVNFIGKATKHTIAGGGYLGSDSASIGPIVVSLLLEQVKRAAVFTGTRLMYAYPEPYDTGCVYCPSGAGLGRWGFTCFNPVLFYGKRPGIGMRPSSIVSFDTTDEHEHPCAKPLSWMLWLVSLASLPGETIIDPFCGSGTTLMAAKRHQRRAIGIELEERYCEIAAQRLAQRELFGVPA